MAWDILVRTFFSDGGLSAGLAKANSQLNQLGKAGPGARAGLKAVEIGARQLAFEAAGLSGGLGQLARGMLMFGGGSALMLAATAGIGALALAYRAFTEDSREAAEAQKKLREELARVAQAARDARTPESQRIGGLVAGGRTAFGTLNQRIADRQRELAAVVPANRFSFETEEQTLTRLLATDKALTDLYAERRKLGLEIRDASEGAASAAKKEADELRRAADEARRLKLELFNQDRQMTERFGSRFAVNVGDTRFRAGSWMPGEVPQSRMWQGPTPMESANFAGGGPPGPARAGADAREIAQMAMMSLMMGARGGASGAFGAAGGLMSGLSGLKGIGAAAGPLGWAGLGLSAVGSFMGLFNNDEERRHKEQMKKLDEIAKRPLLEPRAVTVNLVGATTGEIVKRTQYEIGRREDRDASDRDGRSP
jgi:hypothetical protein